MTQLTFPNTSERGFNFSQEISDHPLMDCHLGWFQGAVNGLCNPDLSAENEADVADRLNRRSQDAGFTLIEFGLGRVAAHEVDNAICATLRIMKEKKWDEKFPGIYEAMADRAQRIRKGYIPEEESA